VEIIIEFVLMDNGLYVAGDGTDVAKTTFGTADGYVYAIPLFKVKRRNSGGYRVENINGAIAGTDPSTYGYPGVTGRNLARSTSNFKDLTNWGTISSPTNSSAISLVDDATYGKVVKMEILSGPGASWIYFYNQFYTYMKPFFRTGGNYTISAMAKSDNASSLRIQVVNGNGQHYVGATSSYYTTTSTWKQYTWTFTAQERGDIPVLYISLPYTTGSNIYLTNLKIEEGSTAGGYSIAPEEVNTRADGLLADVIDANDVVDMRHTISLSNFNYQTMLEQNFDKLLRGELQTKERLKLIRERFSLTPAPKDMVQELMPVNVYCGDGVTRSLTNVFGNKGVGNRLTFLKNGVNGASQTTDSNVLMYGEVATKVTLSSTASSANGTSYIGINQYMDKAKYYLVAYDIKMGNMTNAKMYVDGTDTSGKFQYKNGNTITTDGTVYIKLDPTFLSSQAGIAMHHNLTGTLGTDTFCYAGGYRIYEIDKATYDKIDVDPAWTGSDNIASKFPYVSSYPNVIENLFPPFTDSGWRVVNAATISNLKDTEFTLNYSTNIWGDYRYVMPAKEGDSFYLNIGNCDGGSIIYLDFQDSTGTKISGVSVTTTSPTVTATAPVGTNYVQLACSLGGTNVNKTFRMPIFQRAANAYPLFVPYGRWYLPYDYANNDVVQRFDQNFGRGRLNLNNAQTYDNITEVIESRRTPQKHITVTQATEGQWTANDTVKITAADGIITGTIDGDTKYYRIISFADGQVNGAQTSNSKVLILDNVVGLAVNDTFNMILPSNSNDISGISPLTVTAIDATNRLVTFDKGIPHSDVTFWYLVETTASSSFPMAIATGLSGLWSGIGTKVATFTVTTPPTTSSDNIKIQYSIVYSAGKGLTQIPTDVIEAKVNGARLLKASDSVARAKTNFENKVTANTDAVAHTVRGAQSTVTSYITPLVLSNAWEFTQADYGRIVTSNGSGTNANTSVNGASAQQMFSFNIIRAITDSFGDGVFSDCVTLTDKINKAKNIVTKMTLNWTGYGSNLVTNPSGTTNFVGKVDASTVENPNILRANATSSVIKPPTDTSWGSTDYNTAGIIAQDGSTRMISTSATPQAGLYAQALFSFNLIEYIKGKYGFTPTATWLRANISALTFRWYGYGNSATGNKATVWRWNGTNSSWVTGAGDFNTTNTVSQVTAGVHLTAMVTPTMSIDDNGFIHYTVTADPSSDTIPSTLYTDYVALDIDMISGYKSYLKPWYATDNTWHDWGYYNAYSSYSKTAMGIPTISNHIDSNGFIYFLAYADPANGISTSMILTDYVELEIEMNIAETGYDVFTPENPFPTLPDNLFNSNAAYFVDTSTTTWYYPPGVTGTGTAKAVGNGTLEITIPANGGVWHVDSTIYPVGDMTFSADVKSDYNFWFSISENGIKGTDVGYGPTNGSFKRFSVSQKFTGAANAMGQIVNKNATDITVQIRNLKLEKGNNPNGIWSEGRKRKKTLNLIGKVGNSIIENPHKAYRRWSNTFPTPIGLNGYTEIYQQADLDLLKTQDGSLLHNYTSNSGDYQQYLFEYDLSHLGLSLTELKAAIRSIYFKWTGYGSGDNAGVQTYGISNKIWDVKNGVWQNVTWNVTNTPGTYTRGVSSNPYDFITSDQKVYYLVTTQYPAGTVNVSDVYIDYAALDITLADYVDYIPTPPIKVFKDTKQVKLPFATKSNVTGYNGMIEVTYRYWPSQDLFNGTSVTGNILFARHKGLFTTDYDVEGINRYSKKAGYTNFMSRIPISNYASTRIRKGMNLAGNKIVPVFSDIGLDTDGVYNAEGPIAISGYSQAEKFLTSTVTINSDGKYATGTTSYFKFNTLSNFKYGTLFFLPMLAEINGEIYMIVFANSLAYNSMDYSFNDGRGSMYKLDGRPIFKNV
jgi:hypothetical protein